MVAQSPDPGLSRRQFIQVTLSVTGALTLGWKENLQAGSHQHDPRSAGLAPNPYLTLHPDGRVTVFIPHGEMGQGISTALSMLVADELDVAWDRVDMEIASSNPAMFGNQATSGSSSVRTRFQSMRQAGATARAMLVSAAASKLGVDAQALTTDNGQVIHSASRAALSYPELLADAAVLPTPDEPPLKTPDEFKLIGKPTRPILLPDILAGKAIYGMDFRLPGMMFAVVARCPWFDGSLVSLATDAALAVPGVQAVIKIPAVGGNTNLGPGVAVVATNTWSAIRGRQNLTVEWQPGTEDSTDELREDLDLKLAREAEITVQSHGDTENYLAQADTVVEANYRLPFLAHVAMEPMNCTAWFHDGRMEIWSPTQAPSFSAIQVADTLQLDPKLVTTHVSLMGGAFGRRLNGDFTVEAALVAHELKMPVKVVWSREDDLTHDFYRPMAGHKLTAALESDGRPGAWQHHLSSPAIFDLYEFPRVPSEYESVGAADMPYRIENRSTLFSPLESVIPRGWWRAVSTTHTVFAVESFVDELASASGRDPLEYRLALLGPRFPDNQEENPDYPFDHQRMAGVLTLAAEKSDWGKSLPEGHGMGIACGRDHLTYAAQVVHVSLVDGQLRIHRVVSAMDCGIVVNPDTVVAQIQGSVIQGLSAAMLEEVTVAKGQVQQDNFDSYPVLRMNQIPERIDVHLVASAEAPTGVGECALPPVAPALTNAVFAASGQRVRQLPLSRSLKI